ncbi:MAG: SDR family oxidoreductase [Candidatus Gastranaerophilales bacterium]|nr:SDR family oxidoreductase [Candidatus Gastranaerophilales bacterium]
MVTGATKGIGRSIAENLKAIGQVYVTGRNEEALKSFDGAGYFVCDLSKEDELVRLGSYIKEKNIDILVNNAGEYIYGGIDEVELSVLNHIIEVNLKAPIYLMNCAVPYMKSKRFGRIINIGSISGVMGEANASLYSSTKAGLIGLSKATGLELAEYGITVNTINPGWVDTELGKDSINDSDFTQEEILECIPQRRFVAPEEVAGLVKYLISDAAKGITGQSINLCAGLSVGI